MSECISSPRIAPASAAEPAHVRRVSAQILSSDGVGHSDVPVAQRPSCHSRYYYYYYCYYYYFNENTYTNVIYILPPTIRPMAHYGVVKNEKRSI